MVKDTEGSNEAIDKGEMVETLPGSQAMACCPRDFTGTWEDLCSPSELGESVVFRIGGFTGPRRTKPSLLAQERCGHQGKEQTASGAARMNRVMRVLEVEETRREEVA